MTNPINYRNRCFEHHEPKCAICGESRIVEVHHIDHNRENDSPINLIPLCPNCHRLYHNKDYRESILEQILNYQEYFSDLYFNQDNF